MYKIRVTHPKDAPKLPAIERSASLVFLAIPDLAWIAEDDVQSVNDHLKLIAEGYSIVAVDKQDNPVGFLNAEVQGAILHIWELSVAQPFQCQGIGHRLIQHTIKAAKQQGLSAITLTTFTDIAWNRPFYEKQGFHIVSETVLSTHLQNVFACESVYGLPRERRCAMQLRLDDK